MSRLLVRNLHPRHRLNSRRLRALARAALAELTPPGPVNRPAPEYELGIHLVSDRRIAALNRRYLRHEGPTDVITFDYGPPPSSASELPALRGDIVISLDTARRQARTYRTSWPAETVRYLVHGLLHLRGHDDTRPAARRRMKRAEDRLLRRLVGRFDFAQLARPNYHRG